MAGEVFVAFEDGVAGRAKRALILVAAVAIVAAWAALGASNALALSPATSSKAASNVDYSTATFNGSVNPNGLETKTYFQYGPTVSYGSSTAEVSVGAGSTTIELGKAVSGLTPNTTFHYRIVASNADGTTVGGDRAFTVGWKVEPLAEAGTQMKDVSCASPTMCMAVRDWGILKWNGSEWASQTLAVPAGAKGVYAEAVSCPSASACVVVGSYLNASSETKTLAESWNGSEWKLQTSATPASFAYVKSVSCSATTECTAVGSTSGPQSFAMRWNGSEWSLQTTANPSPQTYLTSVSCMSSSFCMAAGFYYEKSEYIPMAQRWNGTEWSVKAPVKPAGTARSWLYDISCVSSSACWSVGYKEVVPATNETMVQFWNGSSWSLQSSPNPEGGERNLEGVSCTSLNFCMAVGHTTNGGSKPFGLKYDGSAWTLQNLSMPTGATQARPFAVSCVISRGCQAVGQYWNASSTILPFAEDTWRAAAPAATTTAATSVGEKSATINGTANPNSSETKLYFEYGTTTSYGSKTAEFNAGTGTGAVERSEALTGLSASTIYHYRIVANNENPETSRGSDMTFRTTGPPTVSTSAAEVAKSGVDVMLKGQVNPNGLSTTYQFEYGTAPGVYTTTVPAIAESAGNGIELKAVSYEITGLTPGTKYYYRITATNAAGKSNGSQVDFTTQGPPSATTGSAISVARKCATLQGVVQPDGQISKYWFEYGTTVSYGTKIPVTGKETTSALGSQSVEERLCGLSSSTLYHFRLVAENGFGVSNGSDQTLETTAAATLRVGGAALKVGAPLKVSGSNFTFVSNAKVKHSCAEAEFGGEVSENPGAVEKVTTPKLQNAGGAKCAYDGVALTVQYSFPSAVALEYTMSKSGEGNVTTGPFTLQGAIYFNATKLAECEWEAQLNGESGLEVPLEVELSGSSKLLKGSPGLCYASETMSGKFAVTSGGNPVEAGP